MIQNHSIKSTIQENWGSTFINLPLIQVKSGFACSKNNTVPHGLPHLRPFNIGTNGEIDLTEIIYIPTGFKNNADEYELLTGDILFNNTNSVELVGKSAIVRQSYKCVFSNHITRLRISDFNKLSPSWLLLCLRIKFSRGFFAKNCNKWIGQAGFNTTQLSQLSIPLPPLNIQQRIVARIESLLGEIKDNRLLLEQMRRDTEELLPNSLDEVFTKLETVTEIVLLGKIATAFNGRASGEGESDIRVFKTKHVYPHSLRMDRPSYIKSEQLAKMPKNRFLKVDDVLMANIAEGTLGRVSYIHESEDNWTVDTQIMILRSIDENILHGKWLYYYLWSEKGQKEILSRRSGIAFADKRGQTHIYPKNIVEIPVPLPPIECQCQAVSHLDFILSKVEEIKNIIKEDTQKFNYLEQAILEKAFRGKL